MEQVRSIFNQWVRSRQERRVTPTRARQRVRRGASYLDDVDPAWYRRVNADTLELADGGSCILGQLHGDFRLGLTRARLYDLSSAPRGNLSPVYFGFHCEYGVDEELQRRDYNHLNLAWQEAVRKRLESDQTRNETRNADRGPTRPKQAPVVAGSEQPALAAS